MRCSHCGAPLRTWRGRCLTCARRITPEMLPQGHALVVHAGTPLRDRAGSPAAVLQTLSRGDTVELRGRDGGFLQVRSTSGATGYIDAVNAREPQPEPPAGGPVVSDGETPLPDADLPYGLPYLLDERLLYYGRFLYDPFGDRQFVLTTTRLIIGGGGAALPKVYELDQIVSAGIREGSNGMALGERTLVMEVLSLTGEIFVAALRDPDRALQRLTQAMRVHAAANNTPAFADERT